MSHYRIIETGEGFKVQQRFLWIFWHDCAEPYFYPVNYMWCEGDSQYWLYESLNDAKGAINRMEHMFYDYKGHEIQYFIDDSGQKRFVDLNNKYTDIMDRVHFIRVTNTLAQMKSLIDEEENEKIKKKENEKVTKIHYINV